MINISFLFSGGHSEYLIENIFHFHLKQSVFDLAVISTIRAVLLFIFYDLLEAVTIKQVKESVENKYFCEKLTYHLLIIFIPFLTLAYSCVKGGLILYSMLHDPNYNQMHLMYNVLVISSVAFCFVEMCFGLGSYKAMDNIKKQMVLHRLNERGQEIDEEGNLIKKKVDLLRVFGLARPVYKYKYI